MRFSFLVQFGANKHLYNSSKNFDFEKVTRAY